MSGQAGVLFQEEHGHPTPSVPPSRRPSGTDLWVQIKSEEWVEAKWLGSGASNPERQIGTGKSVLDQGNSCASGLWEFPRKMRYSGGRALPRYFQQLVLLCVCISRRNYDWSEILSLEFLKWKDPLFEEILLSLIHSLILSFIKNLHEVPVLYPPESGLAVVGGCALFSFPLHACVFGSPGGPLV